MTQTAAASLKDVDVTMMLFEPAGGADRLGADDDQGAAKGRPRFAVINKVDLLDNFAALEARKKQVERIRLFDHIVTISAKDGTGCDDLFALLKPLWQRGPALFSTMTPSPICRRKSWWLNWCAKRRCCSCGRRFPRHCSGGRAL